MSSDGSDDEGAHELEYSDDDDDEEEANEADEEDREERIIEEARTARLLFVAPFPSYVAGFARSSCRNGTRRRRRTSSRWAACCTRRGAGAAGF